MSINWPEYTIQQLVDDKILAKPKDGNHGSIHPKSSDYVDSGVPFIMATDMLENGVDFKNCKFITEEMANSLRKGFAEPGDVLLSHKATIGRTSILQNHSYSTVVLTPQVTYYRVLDKEVINNKYLHYYFKSEGFQNLFSSWAGGGSTRAYLGITDQRKLPITVPPIDVQRDIAQILGDLDKKIHLNQQTNETLEAMAQAMFKSWFVDFDPVRAKIDAISAGHDSNRAAMAVIAGVSWEDQDWDEVEAALQQKLARMTEHQRTQLRQTAELFSDELVESEIGEVPKGWGYGSLGDISSVQGGYAFKSKLFKEEGYPVVKIKNINEDYTVDLKNGQFLSAEDTNEKENYELNDGDYVLAMTGATVGKTGIIVSNSEKVMLNQRVAKFESDNFDGNINWFIHSAFLATNLKDQIVNIARGSAQPNISASGIESAEIIIPSEELIEKFINIADPLFNKWIDNYKQNEKLSSLRDVLLPKLISGEINKNV